MKKAVEILEVLKIGLNSIIDENGFITVTDLYSEFREWYREAHNLKAPPRKEFAAGMERELGKPESMFVSRQNQSENTGQKTKKGPKKLGWKGFALQGENHSDLED